MTHRRVPALLLRLLTLLIGVSGMGAAVDSVAAEKAKAAEKTLTDPAALSRRSYAEKRALVHPAVEDGPAQRSTDYLATLRVPAAPGAPTAASIPDGNAQLAYVRREHATPQSVGIVVLFDDRERLPASSVLLGQVAEKLALRGWDTWTLALPEVAPGAPLPRERSHAVLPLKNPGGADDAKGDGKKAAKGKAQAKKIGPQLSRRRFGEPVANGKAVPTAVLAPAMTAWQALATQRMALLMQAAQAAVQNPTPAPLVVIGAGLAADLVAQRTVIEKWSVAAVVLIDPLAPPADVALTLDADVAALRAPLLVVNWRAADPIAPAVWLRLQRDAHRALPASTSDEVGEVVAGWLQKALRLPRSM